MDNNDVIKKYASLVEEYIQLELLFKNQTKDLRTEIEKLKNIIKEQTLAESDFINHDQAKKIMVCGKVKISVIKRTYEDIKWDDFSLIELLKELGQEAKIKELRTVIKREKIDLRKTLIKDKEDDDD